MVELLECGTLGWYDIFTSIYVLGLAHRKVGRAMSCRTCAHRLKKRNWDLHFFSQKKVYLTG